jgi:transposase
MMAQKIQRVDTIPLIIAMLKKMGVEKVIDSVFVQHGNWSGLSYGQLTVLFVTYVLHSLTHRFSGMESWANQHKAVIERATGWQVGEKDATDDRVGRLSEVLGENDEDIAQCQDRMGQGIIGAYQLPTQIVRYDTTSFNVYHHPDNGKNGILQFGHSKNYRSDLLQFKQGLATLDPAGVPILSETFYGNRADDPCYLPAWRRMVKTIGSPDFLFIADCKAASLQIRTAIDHEKGYYLFPLPMTGETPRHIKALVLNPEQALQEIVLAPKQDQDDVDRVVGKGFVVNQPMEARLENVAESRMTLDQSTKYYRDEWLVERGFHRFKKGHIPALPLFLRLPKRIKGLMLMLTIALQVLTLMEFVSRMELSKSGEPISWLVPGNPKMKTNRPTAERLLSQFDNLHLLIEEKGKKISGVMVEDLTFLQKKILSILQLPEKIYDLSFKTGKNNSA